jgi:hypothetical protein
VLWLKDSMVHPSGEYAEISRCRCPTERQPAVRGWQTGAMNPSGGRWVGSAHCRELLHQGSCGTAAAPGLPGEVDMSHLLSSVLESATTTLGALVHIVANGFKW